MDTPVASPTLEVEWVRRAQRGGADAFRCLVEQYERRLLYFVRRFVPNVGLALDVLQDVWLTAFRGLAKLRRPEAFRVWLYRIAHDRVVSLVRRQRRERDALDELGETASVDEADPELDYDHAELVHHSLHALTSEHREVLMLRYLEDMSLDEIAEVAGCGLGTVKSRLHYAKRELRRVVEDRIHG